MKSFDKRKLSGTTQNYARNSPEKESSLEKVGLIGHKCPNEI